MYNTYTVPCGVPMTFYWNVEDALMFRTEFMTSLTTNETFALDYIQCMTDMSQAYATDNVLVAWGYDFAYYDANNTFGLIDDIMAFLRARDDVPFDLYFSTVQNFTHSVREEMQRKQMELQVFHEDFFPMEEIYKDSFWTGYFSSRANSKKKIREYSSYSYQASTIYAMDKFKLPIGESEIIE